MSDYDPFSMDASELRWKVSYAFAVGLSVSDPRAQVTFADEEIDKLPGQLPKLAREMHNARSGEAVRDAADRFLTASEEYL